MMFRRIASSFLLLLSAMACAEPFVLRVCEADLDYPPFDYFIENDAGQRQLDGFSIRLLRRIADERQWTLQLTILPFNRCLRDTADLSVADMVLTASINAEREKNFLASTPFWFVHFHAFYAKKSFPFGLPLRQKSDLMKFKLCGVKGHNFSMFGVPDDQIDLGADSYDAVFKKIARGRCDVFPYNLEVIEGYQLLGKELIQSNNIAHQEIPDVPNWPIQMLIARRLPQALSLQSELNESIEKLRNSGELERLYRNSFSPIKN